MFHFDRGLKLTSIDLAIDVTRRQPRGFISHAHADHIARHELAFGTPATAQLCQLRLGPMRFKEMPFGEPLEWGGVRLTAYPAGHVLGSAMLLAETGRGDRLLYSGDFRLRPALTAESAQPPAADALVMESTYGHPRYRFPPRETVIDQFLSLVHDAIHRGATPVVYAYTLGKAQEATRILTDAGFTVLEHPLVSRVSDVYRACGCDLGDARMYAERPTAGCPIVAPPPSQRGARLAGLPPRTVTISLTGWALDPWRRRRMAVDHALPLSDHADYDELLELIERAAPGRIYCTHGPTSFVDHLRELGHDAYVLGQATQRRLF